MTENDWLTISAASMEEAELIGLARLGALREEVEIEVLDEGRKGFLGLGGRAAKIRIRRVAFLPVRPASAGQVDVSPSPVASPPEPQAPAPLPVMEPAPEPQSPASISADVEPAPIAPEPAQPVKPVDVSQRQAKKAAAESAARPKKAAAPRPPQAARAAEAQAPEPPAAPATPVSPELSAVILEEAGKLLAGFKVQLTLTPDRDEAGVLVLDIRGRDARSLVGRDAHVMEAVQHLLRLLVQRRLPNAPEIVVDADGYWERHDRKLRLLAQRTADQVAQTGRPLRLRPMSARDRRVIHVTLRNDPRVSTESQGSGAQRAVVVTPRREA